MKQSKFIILIFVAFSCTTNKSFFKKNEIVSNKVKSEINSSLFENDTALILKQLFDSALNNNRITINEKLFKFGDSIILAVDKLLERHIPKNLAIKVMTRKQICKLAIDYKMKNNMFGNFLIIDDFYITDDKISISLFNRCIKPFIYNSDEEFYEPSFNNTLNCKCSFEKYCNVKITMTIIKIDNLFEISKISNTTW